MKFTNIPLFKVFASEEAAENARETVLSGWTGQGPKVAQFEKEFQHLVDAPSPILALNSCTSALHLALYLLGVRPGTCVVTSPMSCLATIIGAYHLGAKIVWADVHPESGLIDVTDVKRKISAYTTAVIPVDWGGSPCDYAELDDLGVPIVQDAAHSLLATFDFSPNRLVCWSYQAIKTLGMGDGGSLWVPERFYERAKLLRWYGLDRENKKDFRSEQKVDELGWKWNMTDINAAIGLGNLPYMIGLVSHHKKVALDYYENLPPTDLLPPSFDPRSSWWFYTILVEKREEFKQHMADRGITVSQVHSRLDEHPCLAKFKSPTPLPGVDYFASRNVALPIHFGIKQEERDRVVEAVQEWVSS